MSRTEEKSRRKPISVINWMLTILFSVIPGNRFGQIRKFQYFFTPF